MGNSNEYMRAYMLERYHARRVEAIQLLGGVCVVCGTDKDLEIDHIDPKTKEIDISRMWSVSIARYRRELKKCQVLCHTHHKRKTSREQSVPHGGGLTGKKNCFCPKCKPKKLEYTRLWKRADRLYRKIF